jgi:hypothetical protein
MFGEDRQTGEQADDVDHVYDAEHYVRCKLCGGWVNGSNPADVAAHRGPLPHPAGADAEQWPDDDDY